MKNFKNFIFINYRMLNKYKKCFALLLIIIPLILLSMCYNNITKKNNIVENFLFNTPTDNQITKNELLKDIKASNANVPFKFSSLFTNSISDPNGVVEHQDLKMKTINRAEPPVIPVIDEVKIEKREEVEKPSIKLDCQFFKGKCPKGYNPSGTFSAKGQHILCGDSVDFKEAKAVAEIRNEKIVNIHLLDNGKGYDSDNPPVIIINNGANNDAVAEAIIDDSGSISVIKVVNPGNKFKDTPIIEIKSSDNNFIQCNLCCTY
jgi:hypothetical protein